MENRPNLSMYTGIWSTTEPAEENRYNKIPDGVYKAQIAKAEIRESRDRKSHYIAWDLNVAINNTTTVLIMKANFMSNEVQQSYLKRDIAALEYDVEKIRRDANLLYVVLPYFEGAVVEFEQITKQNDNDPNKPFVNHYFKRLIKPSGKPEPELPEVDDHGFMETEDDDLPF